jgi:terminal uridylyltransferase
MHSPRHSHQVNGGTLYQPGKQIQTRPEDLKAQTEYLGHLCNTVIANAEISPSDIQSKEGFRVLMEQVCRDIICRYEEEHNGAQNFPRESIQLRCFGSLASGFATKAADMDLGLFSPMSELQPDAPGSPIPRLLEKALLDQCWGARLLTRTRVPIIKVCERPPESLRLGLLAEREKWETGAEDDCDEELPDETSGQIDEPQPPEPVPSAEPHTTLSTDKNPTDDSVYPRSTDQILKALRQGPTQSLQNYCGAAKKALRKAGGRDVTYSNAYSMTESDFLLLNQTCLAFVDGLTDSALRQRMLNKKSLSRYNLLSQHQDYHRRSLHGVFLQAEGEKMAMMWESRQVDDIDNHQRKLAQKVVWGWGELLNKADYGVDLLGYNKDLQYAVDQLGKIPSLRVLSLSQAQHESASSYYATVIKTMNQLGGRNGPSDNEKVLPLVIRQYVSGIYNSTVRKGVLEFVDACQPVTLLAVARRHKSFQLAQEFQKALDKGLYSDYHAVIVREFVTVLQSPMREVQVSSGHTDFLLPLTNEHAHLWYDIEQIGDPSRLTPNQPRDPYRDRLEFPKTGIGAQCDINFSAHLALQNTVLLRCYSLADPRVRPIVLFVKHWAKARDINTPYRGTLSSYGYVLMVLHYLINIAEPFVCPNLQELAPGNDPNLTPQQIEETVLCKGRDIRFWRDEREIFRLASQNVLTQNKDSTGCLLRGFFEYFAHNTQMSTSGRRGFDWGRDVLSLRTHGGLLNKQAKGWTGAKTIIEVKAAAVPPSALTSPALSGAGSGPEPAQDANYGHRVSAGHLNSPPPHVMTPQTSVQVNKETTPEVKEIRHRYLFAIEDPFELDHNVARTVTHNGIVAIRDEFRRAWRLIRDVTNSKTSLEELLEDVSQAEAAREKEQFAQLLKELHGVETPASS